jgi:RNA polymerase sigma-32 factor
MAKPKNTGKRAASPPRKRAPRPGTTPGRGATPNKAAGRAARREDPADARADADGDGEIVDAELVDDAEPEVDDESLVAEVASAVPDGGDVDVDDAALDPIAIGADDGAAADAAVSARSAQRGSVAKYDPMAAYMQEVRRIRVLTREEEHALAVRLAETGDAAAARKLIEANLRLVVKIAYEYRRAHRNLLDLVQEGNIGLLQAVRKYDPYRGVKLSSYAAWWIRAYILKFILNNWRLVKIGTTQAQRKLFFNLRKEKEKLQQLGFVPEPKLLAERLEVTEKDVVEMEKRMASPDASLDAPLGGDDDGGGGRTRLDLVRDPAVGARPDVAVEQREFHSILQDKLREFAGTLEGREETIFRERWLTDAPLTLQEIGDRYGISRERARQLEKRLLGRLRTYLEQELGSAVDISALARE